MEVENLQTKNKSVSIVIEREKPKASIVYNTYWKFAYERQNIFFKRLSNPADYPWTSDSILRTHKFTNAYRATDRVSQYLISEVIQKGATDPKEVFFRIILFKLFNKISTWEFLRKKINEITFRDFDVNNYSKILTEAKIKGEAIYSNAYIMASGGSYFHQPYKHENHLLLLRKMMTDNLPGFLADCQNMEAVYNKLLEYPSIGSFLAYQYTTDINYSDITSFSEMDFVKAGPGAKDGIKKCFVDLGDYTEEDTIRMVCDKQEQEFDKLGLEFKTLWGRRLQLIDCQNLFCEVDKYSRVKHPDFLGPSKRTRIKQKFCPSSLEPISYKFPIKWNLSPK